MPMHPPYIARAATAYRLPDFEPSPPLWFCAKSADGLLVDDGHHARWTRLLQQAEASVGHVRFGEPRWERLEPGVVPVARPHWVIVWPCRACDVDTMTPASHRCRDLVSKVRIARMMSNGPLTDA